MLSLEFLVGQPKAGRHCLARWEDAAILLSDLHCRNDLPEYFIADSKKPGFRLEFDSMWPIPDPLITVTISRQFMIDMYIYDSNVQDVQYMRFDFLSASLGSNSWR
jgi:hypothetical protein